MVFTRAPTRTVAPRSCATGPRRCLWNLHTMPLSTLTPGAACLGRALRLLTPLALAAVLPGLARAQGCVAAHGAGVPMSPDQNDAANSWDLSVAHRWFTSDRHYVGTAYQEHRDALGDQVINHSKFTDLTVNYTVTPRYRAALTIPYVSHDRSQVVKDAAGNILTRFHTQSSGLADVTLVGNAWVFDPAASPKGNLQVGLGLLLPTGTPNVKDTFSVYDRTTKQIVASVRNVDQSIQPGIGGYGIIVSLSGYRLLGAGFTGYVNGSYTITPQEDNGTVTSRSSVYEATMSIADTYLGRLGLEYTNPSLRGVSLSLGLRAEGVAVYDLVGGSDGFRRPGYSVAVEPGIGYTARRWSARLYVPVAIQRDRLQSVPDKKRTWATGTYAQGDAAFANYLVALSLSYRL